MTRQIYKSRIDWWMWLVLIFVLKRHHSDSHRLNIVGGTPDLWSHDILHTAYGGMLV